MINCITRSASAWLFLTLSGVSCCLAAPFTVDLTDNPLTLAQAILGPGITIVGTPTLSSQPGQSGVFTGFDSGPYVQTNGRTGQYQISSGAILTSGIASAGMGSYIGGPSYDATGAGDPQLSTLSGMSTFDADVLTIRFTAAYPVLFLNYAFASAEYPPFTGGPADALGIFVNGVNIAVVPGTTTPVSVNSVNVSVNASLYTQDSNPATPFNYSGLTTLLTARANVSTTEVNTLRIAIADSVDGSLDSAVLIQGGSVAAVPEPGSFLLVAAGALLLATIVALRYRPTKHPAV